MKNKKKENGEGNGDFYFDDGLMVFTRHYHLKRGYCCNNGCRHCPYKAGNDKNAQTKNL
jgi:hypothetical protein